MATALTRVILDRDPELRDAWGASFSSDRCKGCADHIRRFPFPPFPATLRGVRSQPDAHGTSRRPGGPQGSCVRCFSSSLAPSPDGRVSRTHQAHLALFPLAASTLPRRPLPSPPVPTFASTGACLSAEGQDRGKQALTTILSFARLQWLHPQYAHANFENSATVQD